MTDSEYFYNLVVELLEDPEEREEADELLRWWNRYSAQWLRETAATDSFY